MWVRLPFAVITMYYATAIKPGVNLKIIFLALKAKIKCNNFNKYLKEHEMNKTSKIHKAQSSNFFWFLFSTQFFHVVVDGNSESCKHKKCVAHL